MKDVEIYKISKGIFWVICDYIELDNKISVQLKNYRLLCFTMPCSPNGEVEYFNAILSNSKKGNSFNHKTTWESGLFGNVEFAKMTRQFSYNYYPRGRVEISNNNAIIYLNQNINKKLIIDDIRKKFGLLSLKSLKVKVDNSYHYCCYADDGFEI